MEEREQPVECDRDGCDKPPTHIEYAWGVAGDDRLFLCKPHAEEARVDMVSWGGEPMPGHEPHAATNDLLESYSR